MGDNKRIVFMGTPEFAVPCLEVLIQEGYFIPAVVTQPDRPRGRGQKVAFSPVKETALKYDIPVLQPSKVKEPAFQQELIALSPDIIVVVAFGQLLPKSVLELPPLGCVNVHASLLPQYRGAAPIHWSVINGDEITGVTTMYMDIGMDTGDMILKAEVPIGEAETTGEIHDKLKELGAEVLRDTLRGIILNKVPRTPQNTDEATYAPMLTRELEKINWNQSAVQLHNLIRGMAPWPGSYCLCKQHSIKIWKSQVWEKNTMDTVPGKVNCISDQGFVVETGIGMLEILEVQPESKRRMSAKDYVGGYGLIPGEILA